MIKRETWAMIVPISLLPAVWAVVSAFCGIQTAAAAMIAATIYVMGAKGAQDGLRMSVGIVVGCIFAVASMMIIGSLPLPILVSMCLTLIVMVALAIIVHSFIAAFTDLFALLCAFAVTMTVCNLMPPAEMIGFAVQVGVAMLVGIWWVGFLGCMIMGALAKPKETK